MKHQFVSKFTLVILAVLLVAATLTGCSTKDQSQNATYDIAPEEAGTYDVAEAEAAPNADGTTDETGLGGSASLTKPKDQRKIILNATLNLETTGFDNAVAGISAAVSKSGGYISTAKVGTDSSDAQFAHYTIRVPAEGYAQLLEDICTIATARSREETSEDITGQYVDVEARLKALKAQESRLLELMAEAGDLADLIVIQDQLTDVQYEIDRYASQKKTFDDLIAYSTITVYLAEVKTLTEPLPESYGQKIAHAFRESWRQFGAFFKQLGIVLVYALPLLLVVAVALAVIRPLVKRHRKKHPKKPYTPPPFVQGAPAAPQPTTPAEQPAEQPAEAPAAPQDTSTP